MPTYAFVTVDVFTDRRFGGNPLAVFPDARGISDADMQALAAEFNLSETTFVLPSDDPAHSARVRIFARTYEMPFAGHPNVGTGYVLAQLGRDRGGRLLFEEIAGLVEIQIARDPAGAVTGATIAAPQPLSLGAQLSPQDIARAAGLAPADIRTTAHPPIVASTGNPFVFAEIAAEALSRATPDLAAFRDVLARETALDGRFSLYLYVRDAAAIRARMFAPAGGTWEDAATGSAATTVAALLLSLSQDSSAPYDIVQGVEMGRPSRLHATAQRGADGIRATVGGACVPVLRGEVTL